MSLLAAGSLRAGVAVRFDLLVLPCPLASTTGKADLQHWCIEGLLGKAWRQVLCFSFPATI